MSRNREVTMLKTIEAIGNYATTIGISAIQITIAIGMVGILILVLLFIVESLVNHVKSKCGKEK
jgi:ABC-type transport system involved in cytochrome bd biosynthesis fused ATPase/permease subunit